MDGVLQKGCKLLKAEPNLSARQGIAFIGPFVKFSSQPAPAPRLSPPSTALPHQGVSDGAAEVVGSPKVGLQHILPRLRLHADEQVVADNAGVIDQDVETAPFLFQPLNATGGGFGVANVPMQSQCRST